MADVKQDVQTCRNAAKLFRDMADKYDEMADAAEANDEAKVEECLKDIMWNMVKIQQI